MFLSVLGLLHGQPERFHALGTVADRGNGNYAYVDSDREAARKVLVEQLSGTLVTIANVIVPTMYYSTPAEVFEEAGVSLVIWANHLLRASDHHPAQQTAAKIVAERSMMSEFEDKISPGERGLPPAGRGRAGRRPRGWHRPNKNGTKA